MDTNIIPITKHALNYNNPVELATACLINENIYTSSPYIHR